MLNIKSTESTTRFFNFWNLSLRSEPKKEMIEFFNFFSKVIAFFLSIYIKTKCIFFMKNLNIEKVIPPVLHLINPPEPHQEILIHQQPADLQLNN